jgi:kumamolisin
MGNDFRAAYIPGVSLTGEGQSVALLEFDAYYPSDIADYESLTGLPNVPIQSVQVGGFDGKPGPNNGEVATDIEMAIAMAPGLSRVLVYEGALVLSRAGKKALA